MPRPGTGSSYQKHQKRDERQLIPSSYYPYHRCQASWCYCTPHMLYVGQLLGKVTQPPKDLEPVGILQHLLVPLIANNVFASLSLSCMCAGASGVYMYACVWQACVIECQPRPHFLPPTSHPLCSLP